MEKAFLTMLEISAGTGAVILAICLFSALINRKFTVKWKYFIWIVLAVRLLIPINPSFDFAPTKVEVAVPNIPITTPFETSREETFPDFEAPTPEIPAEKKALTSIELMMIVWAGGVFAFVLWQGISYFAFRRRIRLFGKPVLPESAVAAAKQQTEAELGIRQSSTVLICKNIGSPMMLGFVHPVLILPKEDYKAEELRFILRHELTHLKRNDIWYKLLMLAANAVHWFNPAVWMMVRSADRDLEISCDSAVVYGLDIEERQKYNETILNNIPRKALASAALSTHFYSGKKVLKERFQNILNTKKRRNGFFAFAAVLLCALLICGFVACSPEKAEPEFSVEAALAEITTEKYPHSSEKAIEAFKEYIRSISNDNAELILGDDALVYSMLFDSYWGIDEEPQKPEQVLSATGEIRLIISGSDFGSIDMEKGNESQLTAWKNAIENYGEISHIAVSTHNLEDTRDLKTEEIAAIVGALRGLSPKVYDELPNPATGGFSFVTAYDSNGDELWRVSFDGYWLVVQLDGDDKGRIFSVEGCGLSSLEPEKSENDEIIYMPTWMKDNSVIIYDENLNCEVIEGGFLTEEDLIGRIDIKSLDEVYDNSIDMVALPNTKVTYDLHGFIQNIYFRALGTDDYYLDPQTAKNLSVPEESPKTFLLSEVFPFNSDDVSSLQIQKENESETKFAVFSDKTAQKLAKELLELKVSDFDKSKYQPSSDGDTKYVITLKNGSAYKISCDQSSVRIEEHWYLLSRRGFELSVPKDTEWTSEPQPSPASANETLYYNESKVQSIYAIDRGDYVMAKIEDTKLSKDIIETLGTDVYDSENQNGLGFLIFTENEKKYFYLDKSEADKALSKSCAEKLSTSKLHPSWLIHMNPGRIISANNVTESEKLLELSVFLKEKVTVNAETKVVSGPDNPNTVMGLFNLKIVFDSETEYQILGYDYFNGTGNLSLYTSDLDTTVFYTLDDGVASKITEFLKSFA